MMRTVNILFILFIANNSHGKYSPYPLHHMVLKADLAVYGTIESVEADYFNLKVEGEAFGDYNGASIRVFQFHDWPCASRWEPYEKGQRVFHLLQNTLDTWRILSAGGEGEMPIHKNFVYVKNIPDHVRDEMGSQKVEKETIYPGTRISLREFKDAINGLRSCFLVKKTKYDPLHIKQICTDKELEKYKSKSALCKWLGSQDIK